MPLVEFDQQIVQLEKKIELSAENHAEIVSLVRGINKLLLDEKKTNMQLEALMKKYCVVDSKVVKLNIGGKKFSTYKANLEKKIAKPNADEFYGPSVLQGLLSGMAEINYDEDQDIFIDRSPRYFDKILNYLRIANTDEIYELPSSIEDLIGLLKEAEYYKVEGLVALFNSFDGSTILSKKQSLDLVNLCGFSIDSKWKLLYRGSLHGFASADFHGKCDGINRTLTIVESSQSNIFGGFTYATWDGANVWKLDLNAFIFSLVNADKKPLKIKYDNIPNPNNTIYCSATYGPYFGNAPSFSIASNANANSTSASSLGANFKHPEYEFNSNEAKQFLAGSNNFQIREIEVYYLI